MSTPPGERRSLPYGNGEAPSEVIAATDSTLSQAADMVPLRHGFVAIYVRDSDVQRIALRRLRRHKRLSEEQAQAYQVWLTEQRQDAS